MKTRLLYYFFTVATLIGISSATAQEMDLEQQRAYVEGRLAAAKERTKPGDEMISAVFMMEETLVYPSQGESPDRGEGPYDRLVIRGVSFIAGTGAPARGPVDIVVEGDRITAIRSAKVPEGARPPSGNREIDASGMYVLPGFINTHAHTGPFQVRDFSIDYIYKLWLAHGITTIRTAGSHRSGLTWNVEQSEKLAAGELDGPDLHAYAFFAPELATWANVITPDDAARKWVRARAESWRKRYQVSSWFT